MAPGAEIFSEWLRRQGYRVIQTPSTYWYEAMPRVYQAFPYHWQIHPTQAEVRGLLKQNRAIALRCSNPLSTGRGAISYHVVYDKAAYELDALDRRTRQNIRSGLKHCTVERVPLQRLAEEGWELEADTVRRQRRQFSMNQAAWRRKYLSAQGLKGFEAWGALVDGKLAASILLFHAESGVTELLSQQCHSRYLPKRANHALAFTVTRHLVNCGQKVFYTLQSLDARESVDEFKLRMGYSAKPVRQEVVFHPLLEPFVNKRTHRLLKWMSAHNRSWLPLAKAEGMVRFHLNGRCSTAVQVWPECLQSPVD